MEEYRDGVPCKHDGCLNHISLPCEGCGRIGGISRFRSGAEKRAVCYCGMQMTLGSKCSVCGYECL